MIFHRMTIHLLYFHGNRDKTMEKWWFNSMLSKGKLEYRRGLSKSIDRLVRPIENTGVSKGPVRNDTDKKIHSWSDSSSYSNVDPLVGVRDIRNLISDDTFLVRDSNRDLYSIYFDIQNQIFEIDNDPSFLSELESSFFRYWNSSYLKSGSKNDDPHYDWYMYDTKYTWNTHINSCIDSYLRSQICIEGPVLSGSDNSSESYIYSYICGESDESENSNEEGSSNIRTLENTIDFNITENSNNSDPDLSQKYRHLWVQCEHCYGLNYKKFFKSKMNICEQCGYHLKMTSSDRIDLLIDPLSLIHI